MPSKATTKKTPARLRVVSGEENPGTPGWRSATDVFKTPASPSPIRRITRRSSIYQRQAAKADITKAKMIVSPPGMKTRARRSSIYQKAGGKLLSPSNLPVRTRRTSMYVNTKKPNLQSINEFSKVWATPIKPSLNPSPVEDSGESSVKNWKGKTSDKEPTGNTPGKKPISSETSSSKKSASKTKKIDVKQAENKSKGMLPTPKHKARKTPEGKTSATTPNIKLETPLETPSKTKQAKKNLNQNQLDSLKTSTPQKSYGEITGKSFYSTPQQTPVIKVPEDLIQFSTGPPKSSSSRSRKRVSMIVSPTISPKSERSAKKLYRKTPKLTKRQIEDSIDVLTSSQKVKKTKTSTKDTPAKVPSSAVKRDATVLKVKLSPMEMTSILKSVAQNDNLAETMSPEDQIKQPSTENTPPGMTTPVGTRRGQRIQSKKLTEMAEMDQSMEEDIKLPVTPEMLDTTLDLNETINTDSRSSRCIIL